MSNSFSLFVYSQLNGVVYKVFLGITIQVNDFVPYNVKLYYSDERLPLEKHTLFV